MELAAIEELRNKLDVYAGDLAQQGYYMHGYLDTVPVTLEGAKDPLTCISTLCWDCAGKAEDLAKRCTRALTSTSLSLRKPTCGEKTGRGTATGAERCCRTAHPTRSVTMK